LRPEALSPVPRTSSFFAIDLSASLEFLNRFWAAF
jgi:hypothetical protein